MISSVLHTDVVVKHHSRVFPSAFSSTLTKVMQNKAMPPNLDAAEKGAQVCPVRTGPARLYPPLEVESGLTVQSHPRVAQQAGAPHVDSRRVTKGTWIKGALRRLSAELCKGNDVVFRASFHFFCRSTSNHPRTGTPCPTPFVGHSRPVPSAASRPRRHCLHPLHAFPIVSRSAALLQRCSLAPPCPLALSRPPVATLVPDSSIFGVALAGCDGNAAFPMPQEHL